MKRARLERCLHDCLEDHKLSRSERQALREVLEEEEPDAATIDWLRHRAFAMAAEELSGPAKREVLGWLQDVIVLLTPAQSPPMPRADAYFGPDEDCAEQIVRLLRSAGRSIDICVFTITDDRVTREILAAHARGIPIRIVTDDDKAFDRGSDVIRLSEAGIPVVGDNTPHHMHHKFAIFDGALLVTGSYNWTRSASVANRENIIVTGHRRLIARFREEFERLWKLYR